MVGIYRYANGLKFCNIVAKDRDEAEKYLGNKYGKIEEAFSGEYDENNHPIYIKKFVPWYNKQVFVIKEVILIE